MLCRLRREDGHRILNTSLVFTPRLRTYEYFCRVLLLFLFLLPFAVHAEYIERFTSDISVQEDATFTVTETIDYRFTEARHGIFREIPLIHPDEGSASWKERYIDITLMGVRMDGDSVPYVIESTNDQFIVRIGDPDVTIDGTHRYELTYEVAGGLMYPKGEGTEFYFNVTGNEWPVAIQVAEVTLRDPDGIFRSAHSCYRGTFGSTGGSCLALPTATSTVGFRTTELAVGEGMTIAQSLNPVRTAKDIRERTKILWFTIPLLFMALFYGGYRVYRYKTAWKTDVPIVPEYEPYPGMKPMYTGILMDGRLDPHDLTACLVYLAQQGYIQIRKTEKKVFFFFEVDDYEITLVRVPDEHMTSFERRVVEILLNNLIKGETISLVDLKSSKSEQAKNYKEMQTLESALDENLVESGFFEKALPHRPILLSVIILTSICIIGGLIMGGVFAMFALILGIPFFVAVGYLRTRRTTKGYEVQDYLEGFKLFLETTERDRYLFHDAPEKSPEQFMEYLPYAIAFGVEKEWAKVFEGITIPNPGWYDGGSAGSFSGANLATSLGAFSTAFAASSGASASSGGGSSGGGAGGGGGGSW